MWFVLPLALALTQQTYYVDDDGAGDFLDLPAAVAATAPGDLLLVAPGTYTAPTITHDLTILASAKWERPWVQSGSFAIDGASDVTLAGLKIRDLEVQDVDGRVRVDDCVLGPAAESVGGWGAVRIVDSSFVVISRSEVLGISHHMFSGEPGMYLIDSEVALVDCEVMGAHGDGDPIDPDPGWDAIQTSGSSKLLLAGCNVQGGYGGCGLSGCAPNGDSIREVDGALELVIQGSSFHSVSDLSVSSGSVHWSGAIVDTPPWVWPETVPAEPYLLLGGVDLPGATRRIKAYGAVGEPCFVYFSAAPWYGVLPGVDGASLLLSPADLFQVHALTLMGQDVAATVLLPLPTDPTLVGFVADVQGLVLTAGGPFLTNPHQIALRP